LAENVTDKLDNRKDALICHLK